MKKGIITWLIIIGVIAFGVYLIVSKPIGATTSEGVAKCIGENSVFYVQLGCSACRIQEEMFGENYKFLNSVDCFYERESCGEIEATPTWIIKGEQYKGVQSIEKLKELTGC